MVNKKQGSYVKRPSRYFSEEVRREVVKKIEHRQLSVIQASREYEVSGTAIYKWLDRYSLHLKKGNVFIVEKKSRTQQLEQMKQRVAELERIIGQKQLEIDVLNKMLELGSDQAGFDIKKKFVGRPSPGSTKTEKGTHTD